MIGLLISLLLAAWEPPQVPVPPQAPPVRLPKIIIPPVPAKAATVRVRVESAPLLGPGWHRHQCPKCKRVTSHGPPNNTSHACPFCGHDAPGNRVHYYGPAPVQWIERPAPTAPPPSRVAPKALPISLDDCPT